MWRLVVCMIVLGPGLGNGFNLSPKHATIISDPQRQAESYFGYTVNLLAGTTPGSTSCVIVGAPRANSSAHETLTEPGVVYHCSVARKWECNPITLDKAGNVYRPTSPAYKHKKDNAWFGAAVDVQEDGNGGRIVVCGPRWINQRHTQFYLMNGICYLKYYPFDSDDDATPYIPLIASSKQIVKKQDTKEGDEVFVYAYGQAGMSVRFTRNNEMILGAPGVKQWTGTSIRYKNYVRYYDEETRRSNVDNSLTIPNPDKTKKLTEFGYFGYSVDSGRFLSSLGEIRYVAGAPRAGSMQGKIFIFDFPKSDEEELNILVEREGSQIGEYFGACVCAVDLNGDGLDDLVVGAPQHSLSTQGTSRLMGDEGRVYVFINEDGGVFREVGDKNFIMGSQAQGAKFGTSISKIGDINQDGFQDIAVGAPFEEAGRGVIYIYYGRSSGIHQKPSQRITAQEIHPSLRGFGMSISRGADVDGNHYNDVAVGAGTSGHAVIIPSQPVITFHGRIVSRVERISLSAEDFSISACLLYTGQHAPRTVNVHITLLAESRAQFLLGGGAGKTSNTHSYRSTLSDSLDTCKEFRVKIQDDNPDFTKPIELQMHYKLESSQQPALRRRRETILEPVDFCMWCPVVDPNQNSFISKKIPYAIDCGNDNICHTNLVVSASFFNIDINKPFVLGTQPKARVIVVVRNQGEQAFLVKLAVSVPRETPLSRLPAICQEIGHGTLDDNLLECDITNSLQPDQEVELELEVDMDRLIPTSVTEVLVFGFNASSAVEEEVPDDNVNTLALTVQAVADVSILGKSSQDKGIVAKGKHTFYHSYEVTNNGPSPLQTLGLKFEIPVSLHSSSGNVSLVRVFEPKAYFDKQPFQCITSAGKFASDDDMTDVTVILNDTGDSESRTRRSESSSQVSSSDDVNQLPANRTLFMSCSNPDTTCVVVQCNASGPFMTQRNKAVVTFMLKVDFEKAKTLLGKRDIVSISSAGSVWILNLPNDVQPSNGVPDVETVNSVFFGSLPEETVGPWVLPVSIFVGILILLLIIAGLVKMGFFRRKKNEELQSLHENTQEPEVNGIENSTVQ